MIVNMKKYSFLVFHKEYDAFLHMLREAGVVHIAQKGTGVSEDAHLQQLLEERTRLLHLQAQGATDQLLNERNEVARQLADTERICKDMQIWGTFSKDRLQSLKEAGYALRFFTCRKDQFREEWGSAVAEKGTTLYFVLVGESEHLDDVLAVSTEVMLEKPAEDWQKDVDALHGLLAAADARIEAWKVANLQQVTDDLADVEHQIDWQKVVLSTDQLAENSLCLLEGYCPVDKVAALNAQLEAQHIYYEAMDPVPADKTPIQLKNNKFTQLFEVFTGMYGWPTYGEFDPTPILAPFYLLFFSMCMGDAGYGVLLVLFGLAVHFKKINISMFEGLGPIIAVLGAGTAVVGMFLGTCLGMSLYDAAWYPQALKNIIIHGNVAGFDAQMVLAIGIGVFHICLAMIVKAICYTKRFGFRENLSTWGWTLLIVGGIIVAAVSMLGNLPSQVTKWIVIGLASLSALGIYIFNTPGRNPLINIGAGLWDTYNMVTGLLGDVLSYVRLYALGLAGGMLGSAFNTLGGIILGDDPSSATIQWLFAATVLLFGHLLNLAMSALGAFVHPLRLTFVEYFKNAGYEGKGEKYVPFKL